MFVQFKEWLQYVQTNDAQLHSLLGNDQSEI